MIFPCQACGLRQDRQLTRCPTGFQCGHGIWCWYARLASGHARSRSWIQGEILALDAAGVDRRVLTIREHFRFRVDPGGQPPEPESCRDERQPDKAQGCLFPRLLDFKAERWRWACRSGATPMQMHMSLFYVQIAMVMLPGLSCARDENRD